MQVNCNRCDGAGFHGEWSSRGEAYNARCLACDGTGKRNETERERYEREATDLRTQLAGKDEALRSVGLALQNWLCSRCRGSTKIAAESAESSFGENIQGGEGGMTMCGLCKGTGMDARAVGAQWLVRRALGVAHLFGVLLLGLVLAAGCRAPNTRCDDSSQCAADEDCLYPDHRCEPKSSPKPARDLSAGEDLSTGDLDPAADLDAPDLLTPDMIPPPDLEPPPDLTPPTPYFPAVQAILDAHGCARSGCHDAGGGLYTPFLIASPSTAPALHQNYTNFFQEPEVTVLQRLSVVGGAAHGGVTSGDPDRKPCASSTAEPCATLDRWYQAGKPEHP